MTARYQVTIGKIWDVNDVDDLRRKSKSSDEQPISAILTDDIYSFIEAMSSNRSEQRSSSEEATGGAGRSVGIIIDR